MDQNIKKCNKKYCSRSMHNIEQLSTSELLTKRVRRTRAYHELQNGILFNGDKWLAMPKYVNVAREKQAILGRMYFAFLIKNLKLRCYMTLCKMN